MTDRSALTQYWRYQPSEGLVMGEPGWLVPGRCYEGVVPPMSFGFVVLFNRDGEGEVSVGVHQVEQVTEEEYRAEGETV